jgi:hypothetical protein
MKPRLWQLPFTPASNPGCVIDAGRREKGHMRMDYR